MRLEDQHKGWWPKGEPYPIEWVRDWIKEINDRIKETKKMQDKQLNNKRPVQKENV